MSERMDRRGFLAGLALGGVGGGAAVWLWLHSPEQHVRQTVQADEPPAGLDHESYMRRAIVQAKQVPALPFGAVIVDGKTREVVAEGHNRSEESPTYHGEIDVINRAAGKLAGKEWTQLVLYTTAEPCPMCQSAIAWAGIGTVVFGSSIPYLKQMGWWQIDIRAEEVVCRTPFRRCVVVGGVLEEECNELFRTAKKGLYRP